MQRRDFLTHAVVLAGLSATSFTPVLLAAPAVKAFTLLRAQGTAKGADLVPLSEAVFEPGSATRLQIEIDGLHLAGETSALQSLEVHAIFDRPDGPSNTFVAWQYHDGAVPSRTDRVRFATDRGALGRFELHYRVRGERSTRIETMSLLSPGAKALAEGDYVLVAPGGDGVASPWVGLRFSGDSHAPLAGEDRPLFDYLPMRVTALR